MILILALIFGDFTYTASPGTWLDYARTGPISEHRFVVYEQNGNKGDYSQGASRKVLDENGQLLYEMTAAEDAWFIINGVLGDEDTYLYQSRSGPELFFWHPTYGIRELIQDGKAVWRSGKGDQFGIVPGGKKLFFMSFSWSTTRKQRLDTLLELVNLEARTPAELFTNDTLCTFAEVRLDEEFAINLDGPILTLSPSLPPGRNIFFEIDLSKDFNPEDPMKMRRTLYPMTRAAQEYGFVSYLNHTSGFQWVIERQGKALIVLNDKTPNDELINDFFFALGEGRMTFEHGVLSLQINGDLVAFDTAQKKIRRYRIPGSKYKGNRNPGDTREVDCDDKKLTVRSVQPISQKRQLVPYVEVDLSEPHTIDPMPRKAEQIEER